MDTKEQGTKSIVFNGTQPVEETFLPPDLIFHTHPGQESIQITPKKLRSFGEISSLRGIQNISRAETPFIRSLWILFVIIMTSLLTIFSSYLIRNYLLYETNWHTRTLRDDKTAFPSITLCAHNPFSLEANRLWSEGLMPSPKLIDARFKKIADELLLQHQVDYSITLRFQDKIETFYTNLNSVSRYQAGHKTEMFPHCMVTSESGHIVAENCNLEEATALHLRRFSHPKYFNCWTVEGQATKDISQLIMLVHLVPSKQITETNMSFIMDAFTRGEGVVSVVHEPGTYPEIERYGIHIQPKRMNQIIYQPVLWNRLATPKAPCSSNPAPISDLGQNYTYTQTQCLNTVLQEQFLSKCGCLNSEYPRPASIDDSVNPTPYITSLDRNLSDPEMATVLLKRLKCVSDVISRHKEIKEEATKQGKCPPRCSYFTYGTRVSVTSWDPNPHNLAAYTDLYRKVDAFTKMNTTEIIASNSSKLNLSAESWSHQEKFAEYSQFADGSFTYISLTRQEFETTMKDEHLVFDVYILISRIGGLCSLCIGLTMAFFIEIVEYVYMRFAFRYRNGCNQRRSMNRSMNEQSSRKVSGGRLRPALTRSQTRRSRVCCCKRKRPL